MSSKTHPNIGLIGEWPLGSTTWKSDNDRNIRALDMISQVRAITADLTVPPASPADGDTYMVGGSNPPSGAAATGEWAGKDGYITRYDAGNSADGRPASWEFWKPKEGWLISIVSGTGVPAGLYQIYSGGAVWWLTDIKSGLNLFVGSDLHVGGTKRINSIGAGFFSALSVTGLTNGKLPRVSTGGGLFADSAFGDDGTTATCSRPLTLNGATRPAWNNNALATMLGHTSFIYSYQSGVDAGSPTIGRNFYLDGTGALKALQTASGSSYPAYLQIVWNGDLAYGTSVSNPTAGATISDMTTKWRVSKEGGVGFFGVSAPTSRPAVTGSRAGNAALADLITKLAACGIISDSTT